MVGSREVHPPAFYRTALESSTVALVVVDDEGIVRYHTSEAARLVRSPGATLCGEPLGSLFKPEMRDMIEAYVLAVAGSSADQTAFVEVSCELADGDARWIEITGANLLTDPDVRGIVLNLADRTEHHRALELTDRDSLTGLGNRRVVERALDTPGAAVVIVIDLDVFKGVNDRYGHAVGDQLLVAVAQRLQNVFGVTGVPCRVGGDEFVVILSESELDRAWSLVETALATIRAPVHELAIRVTATAGIALSRPGEGRHVLARADAAMYAAKAAGRGGIAAADGEQDAWERRRSAHRDALDSALSREAKLKAEVVRLADENRRDERTGLLGPEAYKSDIESIDTVVRQTGGQYSIALCDVDYFGLYNSRYLYERGDAVLRLTADALRSACRPGDLVYRYGGEEFVVVLRDTQLHDAAALAERLRSAVAALNIPHENRPDPHHVTISVGVAALDTEHHRDHHAVFEEANERLGGAKTSGRNRVGPVPLTA